MSQTPPDLPPAWKPPHTPGRPPHQHPGHGRRGVAATGFLAGLVACLTCRCGQSHEDPDERRGRWCDGGCGGCDGCGDCCDGCDCCSCDCSC